MPNRITDQSKIFRQTIYFVAIAALATRLVPALSTAGPLNDGGLFYSMIADILNNHFLPPVFTTYNRLNIPFAYPPLGFYLSAALAEITGLKPFEILHFVPILISSLAIPFFAGLAARITKSLTAAFFASLMFAAMPLAFTWQIMGGGITRSLGQIFAILTWAHLYDHYTTHEKKSLLKTILFGALTVLSHPEAALQTALGAALFWFYFSREKTTIKTSLIIAAGVLLLSMPWWLTVLLRFGTPPFIAVFKAGAQNNIPFLARLVVLFQFKFTDEPFLSFCTVLGLLGFFFALTRKRYFLPVWLAATILVDWRSGARFAMLPLAMLAGLTLHEVIFPALQRDGSGGPEDDFEKNLLGTTWSKILTGYLFIYLLSGAFFTAQTIGNERSITSGDLQAIEWIKSNTPAESRIATLTGMQPLLDPLTEWFPALSERHVVNSVFGREWINDNKFGQTILSYEKLQTCAVKNPGCLTA